MLISADKSGVINLWDLKINTPIVSNKIALGRISAFMIFSNKEGFVLGNEEGVI
jgi:hypothetical protein